MSDDIICSNEKLYKVVRIVDKNEYWIDKVHQDMHDSAGNILWDVEEKLNEIIRVLNKITNPEVEE